MSKIYQKLLSIQTTLKAPKKEFNKFGGYKYRSCENILEAVKPHLSQQKLSLTITDEVVFKEGRYYVKATATITDIENGEQISVEGWAREEESKKGMDGSQVTGASSSYARKYALNGLFAIDDNKDSDTTNNGKPAEPKPETDPKLLSTQNSIVELCVQLGGKENKDLMTTLKKYTKNGNPKAIKNLDDATTLLKELEKMKGDKK